MKNAHEIDIFLSHTYLRSRKHYQYTTHTTHTQMLLCLGVMWLISFVLLVPWTIVGRDGVETITRKATLDTNGFTATYTVREHRNIFGVPWDMVSLLSRRFILTEC